MKKFLILWLLITNLFFSFITTSFGWDWGDFIGWWGSNRIIYCNGDDCSLQGWIDAVGNSDLSIETQRPFSEWIQDIVIYLMSFITIIAVIYIIYAGFRILVSAWDDEQISNSKKTILSVAVGIILIWLAYAIVRFIISIVTTTPPTP